MSAAIVRQWLVLSILPRPPRKIDTASIEKELRARGISIHRRTIQRDLVELATVFPLVVDERSKPYGWRWRDDADLMRNIPFVAERSGTQMEIRIRGQENRVRALLARLAAEPAELRVEIVRSTA